MLLLITLSNIGSISAQSRALTISNEIKINDDLGSAIQSKPEIALYSNWLYAVWQDKRNGDFDIYFSASGDSGLTWGKPGSENDIKINDDVSSIASQENPEIAVNNAGIIFVIWEDNRFGNWDIFISSSSDNGDSWNSNRAINGTVGWPADQRSPSLDLDERGYLYIAFESNSGGFSDIEVVRSTDSGSTFSTAARAAGTLQDRTRSEPELNCGKDNSINIIWVDTVDAFNSYLYFSSAAGNTWTDFAEPSRADDGSVDIIRLHPGLTLDESGDIYVTWLENELNRYNILFDRSYNGGSSFYSDIKVNVVPNSAHSEAEPEILVTDTGIIYIAWIDVTDGNHIVISDSVDGGLNFINESVVDTTTRSSRWEPGNTNTRGLEENQERLSPVMTADGSDIYILWEDYRDDPLPSNQIAENGDVYFASTTGLVNHAPKAVLAEASPKSWYAIQLNWTESHEVDFNKYSVQISNSNKFDAGDILKTITVSDRLITSHVFTDLTPETKYYFRVTVTDDGGYSVTSSIVSASTLLNQPPDLEILEPDGVNDFADKSFILKWNDEDADDSARIQIFYLSDLTGEKHLVTLNENDDGTLGDSYTWDTTDLAEGEYYIKFSINDTYNIPVVKLSDHPIIVNHTLDKAPPVVTGLIPFELEEEVSVNSVIVLYFDEPLNESAIDNPFTLHSDSSGLATGSVEYNRSTNSITFKPDKKLDLGTWYDVTFNTFVQDVLGNGAQIHISWKFRTESIEVLFVYPENGYMDIVQDRDIVIVFSESMNTTTVEQTFIIQPSTGGIIFNWSLNGSRLIIHHDILLQDTNYSINLGPRMESKYGKILNKRKIIIFRTTNANIAPELTDHGFFKLNSDYLFYVEYRDFNNDSANLTLMHLLMDDISSEVIVLKVITTDSARLLSEFYEPDSALMDSKYINGEIFLVDIKLEPGEYSYYFEFEDIHGTRAVSDTVPLNIDDAVNGPVVKEIEDDDSSDSIIFTVIGVIIIIIFLILYIIIKMTAKEIGSKDDDSDEMLVDDEDNEDIKIESLKPPLKSKEVTKDLKKVNGNERNYESEDAGIPKKPKHRRKKNDRK
jgi:hypothetical protein